MNALEFDRLVQKYQSLVYTICHQLVPDEGDAQDLTQETFLKMIRGIDRFDTGRGTGFGTWLVTIARNLYIDAVRRRVPSAELEALREKCMAEDAKAMKDMYFSAAKALLK